MAGHSPGFCSPCQRPGSGYRSDASHQSGSSGRPGQWSKCSWSVAAPAGHLQTPHRPAGLGTCGQIGHGGQLTLEGKLVWVTLHSWAHQPLAELSLPRKIVLCHETLCPAHMLPGHNLRPPGQCAGSGVKSLDSASCISCRLCDFGQVTALSGLTSFISKMKCLDRISDFLSFSQRNFCLTLSCLEFQDIKWVNCSRVPGGHPETLLQGDGMVPPSSDGQGSSDVHAASAQWSAPQ